jgi:arylsulfatase A-like enzyme
VGAVVRKLKDEKLWDNTLLFFLTDNGGARAMEANNGILHGFKGSLWEGGIRTPWIMSWPARFKGGRKIDIPVISIDILPTVLDAIGFEFQDKNQFDGKSILPLLTGESKIHHETIFWNSGPPRGEWAVRQGNWKARGYRNTLELYDLSEDPGEQNNISAEKIATAKSLKRLHDEWLKEMEKSAGKSRYDP